MTETPSHGAPNLVQISAIAGRYLVFDHHHISLLRRHHGVCGVLTGTVPQSPTQNVFLGVPLELRPEDVAVLVEAGIAAVRDEVQIHLAVLQRPTEPLRQHYVGSVKSKREIVERALHEHLETRHSPAELRKDSVHGAPGTARPLVGDAQLHGSREQDHQSSEMHAPKTRARSCSVSPTVVGNLPLATLQGSTTALPHCGPLHRHLYSKRFFMTPGLRFGARFSVYPGDPFRYHAHFLANDYGWDEGIPLLDLVGAGRLSTAVKKGFLAGSKAPTSSHPGSLARVFCVEWAGM
ncbi:hypothetical protein VUR80DRAFT_6133 [Thermomyces stellatus]